MLPPSQISKETPLTHQKRNLNSASQQNLHTLVNCEFFAIFKEVLHAAPKLILDELFKGLSYAELLISVSQKT